MECRDYDPSRDKDAVHRIWRETGWLEKGKEEAADLLIECGRAMVAAVNGEAECLATSAPGADPALPTLAASVGAFTRMWLGVRPATGLAATDDLFGPQELLERLDRVLRLPDPKPDWDF